MVFLLRSFLSHGREGEKTSIGFLFLQLFLLPTKRLCTFSVVTKHKLIYLGIYFINDWQDNGKLLHYLIISLRIYRIYYSISRGMSEDLGDTNYLGNYWKLSYNTRFPRSFSFFGLFAYLCNSVCKGDV